MHFCKFSTVLLSSLVVATVVSVEGVEIVVGKDPTKFNFRWQDGACYLPIKNVRVGDTIKFNFRSHDVYKLKSREAFDGCDFAGSEELAPFGESPYSYEVTEEDAMPPPLEEGETTGPAFRSLYFSCSVGSHCLGKQRVRVDVDIDYSSTSTSRSSGLPGSLPPRTEDPLSKFVLGADDGSCARVQNGEPESILDRFMETSCDEPTEETDEYGRVNWFRTCLSPPLTLTPGGVVNQATILNYPFPIDHRVVLGRRTWEFVQGDLDNLTPVPVNQLYIHHILGGIVMGNGAESINRVDEDAPFPPPFARLSGDFDDLMTFHLIDLRETGDYWLECLECRCKDGEGSYLDIGGSGGDGRTDEDTGGIACCHNCTALTTPTIDYRMRYNVSWSEVKDEEAIVPVVTMTGDIARALDKFVEWDVPMYEDLPESQRSPENPLIQVLYYEGSLKEIFGDGDDRDYSDNDFDTYKLHRCIGHMHIGAVEAWIMYAETNEVLCHFQVTYGEDPSKDEQFVTAISVKDFVPPIILSGDTPLKMVTHYDATVLHTGVMGLFTLFVSNSEKPITLHKDETKLIVDLCETPKCNASMLPSAEGIETCFNDLEFFCDFFSICTCEQLLDLPIVQGGCEGELVTQFGNYPVKRFCAEHCGCNLSEEEENEIIKNEVEIRLDATYKETCTFATGDCKTYLSNMYTCAEEMKGGGVNETVIHSAVSDVLKFHEGSSHTLEMAKLGNDALQRFHTSDANENIQICSRDELILMDIDPDEMSASGAYESTFSGFASTVFVAAASVLLLNLY